MKKIALVGMPNTGKSTLFNRLTGAHAKVGNWPGITVDLLSARLIVGGDWVQLIDLPGIYDLCGHAEDEKVVTTFLKHQRPDLVMLVMSATKLHAPLAVGPKARNVMAANPRSRTLPKRLARMGILLFLMKRDA